MEIREQSKLLTLAAFLWNHILPISAITIIWVTREPWVILIVPIFFFIILPVIDYIVGEGHAYQSASKDSSSFDSRFFKVLLYLQIPLHYFIFLSAIVMVSVCQFSLWANLIIVVTLGFNNGLAILVGHELGHKSNLYHRLGAKVAFACVGYGHFLVEHNQGHHIHVATIEDSASAGLGESIYAFALREMPGEVVGGLTLEAARLKKKGLSFYSLNNQILQSYVLTILIATGMVWSFGFAALPWIILHHLAAASMVTFTTYVEHYGLLRAKQDNGKYVPTTSKHSWDNNFTVSNLLLVNIQRHSDHHAHPMRFYHELQDDDNESPRLPFGYPALFIMSAIPALWFKVMDPKVLDWANGDLTITHIHEPARKKLEARWG